MSWSVESIESIPESIVVIMRETLAASIALVAGFSPILGATVRLIARVVRRRRRARRGTVQAIGRPRAPGEAPIVIEAEFIEEETRHP